MSVPQLSKRIPNQRWWRILPPVLIAYCIANIDRSSLAFTIAGGMRESIGMTATMAGLAGGVYFVGNLILQAPGGHIAEKASARNLLAICTAGWGIVSIITGFVTVPWQLLTLRFLLGITEGATLPTLLTLLTHWFPSEERGRATATFMMGNALAFVLTGPLSGWIITAFGWRYVFFIQGALSLLFLVIWLPLIEDHPQNAKFLSERERNYLVGKLELERQSLSKAGGAPVSYWQLLSNTNLWKLIFIYFFIQLAVTALVLWLPTMIRMLTRSNMTVVGWLSSIPFLMAVPGLYFFGALADRSGNRKLYTIVPVALFSVCFFLSTQTKSMIWVSYAFLVAVGFFQQGHIGAFWSIPPQMFPREVAVGARGLINGCGNLGGFFGPTLVGWAIGMFHSSDVGIYVLCCSLVVACLITLTLPASLTWKPGPLEEAKAKAVRT